MKEFKKKIIILIIIMFMLLITIILLIGIMNLKTEVEEENEEMENLYYEDVLDIQEENSEAGYIIMSNCIEKYLQFNIKKDKDKLAQILESELDEVEQIDEHYYLKIDTIYKIERINDTTYFVKCLLNKEPIYFAINVDYMNNSFSIRKIDKNEFNNAKENKVASQYKESITIESNSENIIGDIVIDSFDIADKYYSKYNEMALNNPEIAFEMLDNQYKKLKFNNDLEAFKEYIENNKERIYNSIVVNVESREEENYNRYIATDTTENKMEIKEYHYTDFDIILDDYTIQSQEDINVYMNLEDEEKIKYNINKIFTMLSKKEYSTIYNLLDNTFKEKNFPTLEIFKKYVDDNFFTENVLGNITMEKRANNYIVTVPYKSGVSSVAEKREKVFVMRLLEGTDFVISFTVE